MKTVALSQRIANKVRPEDLKSRSSFDARYQGNAKLALGCATKMSTVHVPPVQVTTHGVAVAEHRSAGVPKALPATGRAEYQVTVKYCGSCCIRILPGICSTDVRKTGIGILAGAADGLARARQEWSPARAGFGLCDRAVTRAPVRTPGSRRASTASRRSPNRAADQR